ncbi:MAG TPA: aminotransferase class I/II-fold pyridoxal phosphate-dependent enzyme [Thermoplasmata archaeon]|nr:aminotransferase class I/II-fold pyridoxal phosphate-dependent enzyme [Thermoplasmata archaeon]
MKIQPFEMERYQSVYEYVVEYDLAESGVHPFTLRELLGSDEAVETFLDVPLGYPQSEGTPELRETVAALYPHASLDNVLVMNGSSEAIFTSAWRLLERGDDIVVMQPNYQQLWGLAKTWGVKAKPLWLREDLEWQFDPEDLKRLITPKTKAVQVCNPNNPTGAIMAAPQRKALLDAVEDAGAWLLSDEVYQGAEREGRRTETLWNGYEKTLVTNGLSKAYGLPGLRVGWLIGPSAMVEELMAYHDYLTLTPTMLSDRLARLVLAKRRREEVLARTREILQKNYPAIRDWIDSHGAVLSHVPPAAGAICYLRYTLKMNSTALVERLRKEKSVLIVPGDMFGMDGYVRIGIGPPTDYLLAGLERFDELLRDLKATKAR